jgi:small Trp-rich protein
MWLLVIGLILVGLKVAEVSPVAGWPWWAVLLPFGATVLWWVIADSTGLTAKREQERWNAKREKRRLEAVAKLRTPQAHDGKRIQRHDPTVDDKR